jgi:hypothetical protein
MTTHPSIDLNTGIDLNFCVPGQKVRLRSGGIADYLGLIENNISLVYLHQLTSGKYVSNGCYWSDQRTDELDVVEILPLKSTMTIETGIDLSACARGQKVKLRDETIATYEGTIDENEIFTHAVDGHSYTRRGTFWNAASRTSPKDVVEILPMESTSGIDLNTCVPGQKLERRDGICVEYVRKSNDSTSDYPHVAGGETYTDDGYFRFSKIEDEWDIVKILPLKSPMNIDLSTCVPGQKVKLRKGHIVEYTGSTPVGNVDTYAHSVDGYAYMNDGSYWKDRRESDLDVVEILPLEYDYKISEKEEEPTKPTPELTHSITDQIDVANPDHVSIIPHEHGVTISIKKGLTTISWRHYNS